MKLQVENINSTVRNCQVSLTIWMGTIGIVGLFVVASAWNGMIGFLDATWAVMAGTMIGGIYATGKGKGKDAFDRTSSTASEKRSVSSAKETSKEENQEPFMEMLVPMKLKRLVDLPPPSREIISYAAAGGCFLPIAMKALTPVAALGNGILLTVFAIVTGASVGGLAFLVKAVRGEEEDGTIEVTKTMGTGERSRL
jgi:hypothetical protein